MQQKIKRERESESERDLQRGNKTLPKPETRRNENNVKTIQKKIFEIEPENDILNGIRKPNQSVSDRMMQDYEFVFAVA